MGKLEGLPGGLRRMVGGRVPVRYPTLSPRNGDKDGAPPGVCGRHDSRTKGWATRLRIRIECIGPTDVGYGPVCQLNSVRAARRCFNASSSAVSGSFTAFSRPTRFHPFSDEIETNPLSCTL
jgi:hypothetical protein